MAQAAIQARNAAKNQKKQQEEIQKHILEKVQHTQNPGEVSQEEELAHQAAEWSQGQGDQPESQNTGETTEYTKYRKGYSIYKEWGGGGWSGNLFVMY